MIYRLLRIPVFFVISVLIIGPLFGVINWDKVPRAKAAMVYKYVAQNGSDSTGDGSALTPWRTMGKAQSMVNPTADNPVTIYVKTAVDPYVEPTFGQPTGALNLSKAISWIATESDWTPVSAQGSRVTIQAAGDGTTTIGLQVSGTTVSSMNGFIIDGQLVSGQLTNLRNWGLYLTGSNKTFTNCTFQYAISNVIRFVGRTSNNNFVNCNIVGNSSSGTLVVASNNDATGTFTSGGSPTYGATFTDCDFTAVSKQILSFTDTAPNRYASDLRIIGGTVSWSGRYEGNLFYWGVDGNLTIRDMNSISLSGQMGTFVMANSDSVETAVRTGGITLDNNNINADSSTDCYGEALIYANRRNDTITLSRNTISLSNVNYNSLVTPWSSPPVNPGTDIIKIIDNLNVTVTGNTITSVTENSAASVRITNTLATSMGSATVRGNTINTKSRSGYIIGIGPEGNAHETSPGSGIYTEDTAYDGKLDGSVIENNVINGPLSFDQSKGVIDPTPENPSPPAGIHGIFMGCSKGNIRNNYLNGSHYGIIVKGSGYDWADSGYGVYSNIITNSSISGIYLKGAINVPVFNNTFILNNPNLHFDWVGSIELIKNDVKITTSPLHNHYYGSGGVFYNNIVSTLDGKNAVYTDSYSYTLYSGNNNLFWLNNVSDPAAANNIDYIWNDNTVKGLSNWKNTVGPSSDSGSIFANPVFLNATANFELMHGSPAIHAGVNTVGGINVTAKYSHHDNPLENPSTLFASPAPSIGAYEADTTAPSNQDTVFNPELSIVRKTGGGAVTIVSSGDTANNVWFAPIGTASFVAGNNMTKAASGTAETILAPTSNGVYHLYVIDKYGNASEPSTHTLTIDGITPTINAGDDTIQRASFSRTAAISDSISGINEGSYVWSVYEGESGYINFSNKNSLTTNITASHDGTYVIRFTAADLAGNKASRDFILTWDSMAPIVQNIQNGDIFNTYPTITFADGTAILNSEPISSGTAISSDGSYTLVLSDPAGNISTTNFIVDTNAPVITLTNPSGNTSAASSTYTIQGTITDGLSGLDSVNINGTALSIEDGRFAAKVNLILGANTFLIRAVDRAGNMSQSLIIITRTESFVAHASASETLSNIIAPVAAAENVDSLEAETPIDTFSIYDGSDYQPLNLDQSTTTYTERPTFKGRTYPNSKVILEIHSNEAITAQATSDSDGNWSYQVDKALSSGAHTLKVTVKDKQDKVLSEKSYNFTVEKKTAQKDKVNYYLYVGIIFLIIVILLVIGRKKAKA